MFANNSETSNSSRCLENAVLSKSSALGLLGNNIIMGISPPPPTVAKIRQTGEVIHPFSSPRDASNRIRKRKAKNWHRFLLSGMLNVQVFGPHFRLEVRSLYNHYLHIRIGKKRAPKVCYVYIPDNIFRGEKMCSVRKILPRQENQNRFRTNLFKKSFFSKNF